MAEVLNLRMARKRKERGRRARIAGENRARYGRSKAEATLDEAQQALHEAHLNAHRRDDGDDC